MRRLRHLRIASVVVAAALPLLSAVPSSAGTDTSTLVTVGSPSAPFSQNKQNEPTLAVDAHAPNVLVSGSNDNIDMEACNAGDDTTCPFTPGVGVSGVYFSFNSGQSWTQPRYSGYSARTCLGQVGNTDPGCTPLTPSEGGLIGTLPWYYENGLVSGGDPAVAFGPRQVKGKFSWDNGSRLYYANLASTFPGTATFAGYEAVAVSRTDDPQTAAGNTDAAKNAWMRPVVVSRQSNTTFSDKEQIWADNAASSPYFGNVYLCWASFRSNGLAGAPAPLTVAVSHDGGSTWAEQQISAAANNSQVNPPDGCTIRTDSHGTAYVFGIGTAPSAGRQIFELMSRSFDGGSSWSRPAPVVGPVTQPGIVDPILGRPTIDGIAGARSDLAPAPSVDIANGAPLGTDATNRIVMSYVSGHIAHPHVYFVESTTLGNSWSTPDPIESPSDRGYYAAPAISPNGTDVYISYNAFTTPYRYHTNTPRELVGVVLHADIVNGVTGDFTELNRSTPGDPRGSSQNNLVAEFLGDYVYAVATRSYGAAVWNDTRRAADCPAMDAWRMALRTGDTTVPRPAPEQDCLPALPAFGNSDIYGGAYADPTP